LSALRAGIPVEKAVPHLPRVTAAMLAFCEAEAAGVRFHVLVCALSLPLCGALSCADA
jgi:hypothetical protein